MTRFVIPDGGKKAALLVGLALAGCSASSSEPEPAKDLANEVDLGAVEAGSTVTFDVPSDALGFNVVVTSASGAFVGIESLVSPSGVAVVDAYAPGGSRTKVALGSRGMGAISVPLNDATQRIERGRWQLVASGIVPDPNAPTDKSGKASPTGTPLSGPVSVSVRFQRSEDGEFHGGALDLHVYVPDGLRVHDPEPLHAIDAGSARADTCVKQRLDLFYAELERLFGIERGNVVFHPIDARFKEATTGEARASLVAQATIPAQGLHVVLTNELSYGGGDPLLGYSVGLPGAANLAGTVRSGIAVALYDKEAAATDAITILHEMGHFVGLMHASDYDGTPDLLGDTPTCSPGEKVCAADDNLMAPDGPRTRAPGAAGGIVSPMQVRVLRGSPIYKARRGPRTG